MTSAAARRAFALLRAFSLTCELRTYSRRAFNRATRYQVHVEGDEQAVAVFREAGILGRGAGPRARPPKRIVARTCCRGAYLRGALLGGGSVTGVQSPHAEIRCATVDGAEFVAAVAAAEGVALRVHDRGRHAIAYAKRLETIADLVALAGANGAALTLDAAAVVGDTKARANRLANADHANLVRASRAAHAQHQAALQLAHEGKLEALPRDLRELAELRLRHPASSLRELAAKCRPPTTKATAHRRLRKLQQLAGRGQRRAGGEAPRTTSPSG